MLEIIIFSLGIILFIFNFSATKACLKDDLLTNTQKIFQLLIIWLIPILGAFLILYMITDSHTQAEVKDMTIGPFYLREFSKKNKPNENINGVCGSAKDGVCGSD